MTDRDYQRKYVVVVADVSAPMVGEKIAACNQFIHDLFAFYQADEYLSEITDISIVASDAEKACEILSAQSVEGILPPILQAQNTTTNVDIGIGVAQELIAERKEYFKLNGICYYRPWIVVLTGDRMRAHGEDRVYQDRLFASIMADMVDKRRYFMLTVCVGNISDSDLDELKKSLPVVLTMDEVYADLRWVFDDSNYSMQSQVMRKLRETYMPDPLPEVPVADWMKSFELDTPEEVVQNIEQKRLCVLVLDVSSTMHGKKLKAMNQCIHDFYTQIQTAMGVRESTIDELEIAIIQYDKEVKILRDPKLLEEDELPPSLIECSSLSATRVAMQGAIGAAIQMVEKRKVFYKETDQPYYTPWIIVMTDGSNATVVDVDAIAQRVATDMKAKRYRMMTIGVGEDANMEWLSKLTPGKALRLDGLRLDFVVSVGPDDDDFPLSPMELTDNAASLELDLDNEELSVSKCFDVDEEGRITIEI